MAWIATLGGAVAVVVGLSASLLFDTPAGPSIVSAATLLFLLSQLRPAS
jgi:zinc transport system permease protein